MEESEALKKLEAALFISGRFMSKEELVALTGIAPLLLDELLLKLKEKYKESAIELEEREGKWKMTVAAEHQHIAAKLATGKAEFSRAEQETLAIIAYKQPIKQSVVVKIRGNKAYEHIKHFIEAGLVRAKKVGHTFELNLGDEFYDYFQFSEEEKKEEKQQEQLKEKDDKIEEKTKEVETEKEE